MSKHSSRRAAAVGGALSIAAAGLVGVALIRQPDSGAAAQQPEESVPVDVPAAPVAKPTGPADLPQFILMAGMSSSDISDAIEAEISACMADAGFRYEVIASSPTAPLERSALREYRSEHGYGVHEPAVPLEDVNEEIRSTLSPEELSAYIDALEGPERSEDAASGGCVAEAHHSVASAVPVLADNDLAVNEVIARYDQLIGPASKAYGECMAGAGYRDLSSPSGVLQYAEKTASRDEELALAKADLDCQSTTLWPMWDEVETRLSTELRAAIAAGD